MAAEGLVERPPSSPPFNLARNSGGPVSCEQDECTEEAGEVIGNGCGLHELWRLLGCGRFRLCAEEALFARCFSGEKSNASCTEPGERCACSRNSFPLISFNLELPWKPFSVRPWPPNRLARLGWAESMCSFHSSTLDRPRWQWGQGIVLVGNASESLLLLPFSGLCCDCCCWCWSPSPSAWSASE